MTSGNETPDTGVTNDMLDRLLEQRVAAAQRQIAVDEAREMWPVNVNAALQALADRVLDHEARVARLEARRG